MRPGSVLVDLAVEQGGNVEGARACETVATAGGVKIVGIPNLAGRVPTDASALYARNLVAFATLLVKDGALTPDLDDDILKAALVCQGGEITNPALKT